MTSSFFKIIGCLLAIVALAQAHVSSGSAHGDVQGGFVFLGRFAFDENPHPVEEGRVPVGEVSVEITLKDSADFADQPFSLDVLQYTDNPGDWDAAYDKSVPCAVKPISNKDVLTFNNKGEQVAPLTIKAVGGTRRRFHYIAVRNCAGFGKFEYRLHFTRKTDSWSEEYGANEVGSNSLYLVYFFLYIGVTVACFYNLSKATASLTYRHPIYQLSAVVVTLLAVSVFFQFVHHMSYTSDGIGMTGLEHMGQIIDIIARVTFILLLLLLAKGWAITRNRLTQRTLIVSITFAFGLVYLLAYFVERSLEDPAEIGLATLTKAFYFLVVALGFVFAFWYAFTAYMTMVAENNPVKRSFMMRIGILFFIYLLSIPTVAFLSFLVDPWIREIVISAFNITFTTVGVCVLLGLLWHSHATKYFEFENPVELSNEPDFQSL